MAPRPSSDRIWYRPKRSFLRSSIGAICGCGVSGLQSFVCTRSAARRSRLVVRLDVRRCADKHADYVLVQHLQDFLRLLEAESVQQFEANLSTPKCRNGVMVGANFDYDRPTLLANAKTNACSFDLRCRHELHLM